MGVELDDIAGEWLRGRRRRPHVDEVDVPLPVGGAAGHVLEIRVGHESHRPAVYAVEVARQRGDPQCVVRRRDAVRHLVAWKGVLPEREIVEHADVPTIADELQRVRSGIGNVGTTVSCQDAVRVGVVLLVRDVGGVVEAECANAGDLSPGAVRLYRKQRARLLLGGGDVRAAFSVPGGALVIREGLREHAQDGHQGSVTRGNPVHSQGFALGGIEKLGR